MRIGGFGLLAIAVLSLCQGGCGPLTFTIGGSPRDQRLTYTVVEPDGRLGSDRVAIVDVTGLIINAAKPALLRQGDNPVSLLHEKLAQARRDPKVKAVILRLNTPGGTVTASDAMYREVLRFKQQTDKPVVVLMMDVAASGGYYLACAGDRIVAYPTAITGSVGVILQTISVKPALDRIGIRAEAMTSGPNKDAGSLFSVLTDEHRAVLQGLVDDFYQRFRTVVRDARPQIPEGQFERVADGRVVSGEQAVELGMVDQVGDLHDAFELARQLAGIARADLVLYHRPASYVGSPYALGPLLPAGTQINVAQFNFPEMSAGSSIGFYYLWQPQVP